MATIVIHERDEELAILKMNGTITGDEELWEITASFTTFGLFGPGDIGKQFDATIKYEGETKALTLKVVVNQVTWGVDTDMKVYLYATSHIAID